MQVMLCQSDLILLHKWGLDDSQSHTTVNYFCFLADFGGFHTIMIEEQKSFSHWINAHLGGMEELAHLLPLKDGGDDLYQKIDDGILLW